MKTARLKPVHAGPAGWEAALQSVSLAWRGVSQASQPTFTYISRALQRSAASPGGDATEC